MGIRNLLAGHFDRILADHGEEVTLHDQSTGNDLTFRAVVRHDEPRSRYRSDVHFNGIVVLIKNTSDVTKGASEVTTRDEITMVFRVGEPPDRGRIVRVLSRNEGFWRVEAVL